MTISESAVVVSLGSDSNGSSPRWAWATSASSWRSKFRARNNRDWYHLLDLCALVDTLIADADGLYHPGVFNDRLLLGLKGSMSEVELHLIQSRLNGRLWEAARRGELRTHLPIGYAHDRDGRLVKVADEAIRETIALIFSKFAELGSARQVTAYLAEEGVLVPHRR